MSLFLSMAIVAATWGTVGVLFALAYSRHGHRLAPWLILGLGFGPLTPLLAMDVRGAQKGVSTETLHEAEAGTIDLSVLVGIDGSAGSGAALDWVKDKMIPIGARVALASVIDYESAANPAAFSERSEAEAHLAELAAALGGKVGTAVLAGNPADALTQYAREESFDLIAVGRHRTHPTVLGSTARKLASDATVPAVIVQPHREHRVVDVAKRAIFNATSPPLRP